MIPTAGTNTQNTSKPKLENTAGLDVQLGNLSTTVLKLRKDAKRFQAQVRLPQEPFYFAELA